MKDMLKLGGILLLVTAIAGGVLAFVNQKTQPIIEKNAEDAKTRALTEALPIADSSAIVPQEDGTYIGYNDTLRQEIVGYVFQAEGKGYSSEIQTLVGIDTSGVIRGMKIISQVETPGLGTKIVEIKHGDKKPWFQQQFIGKTASELTLTKDPQEKDKIVAITGATISSRAVTLSVKNQLEKLNQELGIE
jgi:electron transport complex protein RnfG